MHGLFQTKNSQASQKFITRVPESTIFDVQHAVAAAEAAQTAWAMLPFSKRRVKMINLLDCLRQNTSRLV